MKAKHTPGPWVVGRGDSQKHYIEKHSENGINLIQFISSIPKDWPNAEPNTQLIAAAPELLDALLQLMEVYESKGQLLSFNVDIARQAIKKATS